MDITRYYCHLTNKVGRQVPSLSCHRHKANPSYTTSSDLMPGSR